MYHSPKLILNLITSLDITIVQRTCRLIQLSYKQQIRNIIQNKKDQCGKNKVGDSIEKNMKDIATEKEC